MNGLTLRENIFVARYVATKNATRAAMEAYGCKNKNVAAVTGYRLLRNVNVSGEIERILDAAGLGLKATVRRLKAITDTGDISAIKVALKLLGYRNI